MSDSQDKVMLSNNPCSNPADSKCVCCCCCVAGGRGKDGAPIITFPEYSGFSEVPEEDFLNVITYLTSIPRYTCSHMHLTSLFSLNQWLLIIILFLMSLIYQNKASLSSVDSSDSPWLGKTNIKYLLVPFFSFLCSMQSFKLTFMWYLN